MADEPVLPVRRRKSRQHADDVTVTTATDRCHGTRQAHSDNEQQHEDYECGHDTSLSSSLGHLPGMTSQHVSVTSESRHSTTMTAALYTEPRGVQARHRQQQLDQTTASAAAAASATVTLRPRVASTQHQQRRHDEQEEEEKAYESVDYSDDDDIAQQSPGTKLQVRAPHS